MALARLRARTLAWSKGLCARADLARSWGCELPYLCFFELAQALAKPYRLLLSLCIDRVKVSHADSGAAEDSSGSIVTVGPSQKLPVLRALLAQVPTGCDN